MLKSLGLGVMGLLFVFLLSCEQKTQQKNIVFMDSFRVFEEFEMKKDLDKKIEGEMQMEKQQVEELGMQYNVATDAKKKAELQLLLQQAQQQFEKKFQDLSQRYTAEVSKELNVHIRNYGKEHKYDLIVSSGGQNNVMYVDTMSNITIDIIKYINREYKK